jgi:hypothetical protein
MRFHLGSCCSVVLILWGSLTCAADRKTDRWIRLIDTAEKLFGKNGVGFSDSGDSKLDQLIDLHAEYSAEVLGRPISSKRIRLVKEGMRLIKKTAGERYRGDPKTSFFQAMRNIASNRALFVEFLQSNASAEEIEDQLFSYIQQERTKSYGEPVSLPAVQLAVPTGVTPLRIVKDGVRLHSDRGTVGNNNRAVDSGETIVISIPLKNMSDRPYRSTSAFLETKDRFVVPDVSEVIYSRATMVGGETVSFAPGTTVSPQDTFTFSISPDCPDSHVIDFELLIWDSDQGKSRVPFKVKVFSIGPLDFGKVSIDDDIPGMSDGNDNGIMEPHETVEYVLRISNSGRVNIGKINATLMTETKACQFLDGLDHLSYGTIPAGTQKPVAASFVFRLGESNGAPKQNAIFRLLLTGDARGYPYSWVQSRTYKIGVSDEFWADVCRRASEALEHGQPDICLRLLGDERCLYRLQDTPAMVELRGRAEERLKELQAAKKADSMAKALAEKARESMNTQKRRANEFSRFLKGDLDWSSAKRNESMGQRLFAGGNSREAERVWGIAARLYGLAETHGRKLATQEKERDRIASTPVKSVKMNIGVRDWFGRKIRYLPKPHPRVISATFRDQNGAEHQVRVKIDAPGSAWGNSSPRPVFDVIVDGKRKKTERGIADWYGKYEFRIDPVLVVIEFPRYRGKAEMNIAIYRTDYGLPSRSRK